MLLEGLIYLLLVLIYRAKLRILEEVSTLQGHRLITLINLASNLNRDKIPRCIGNLIDRQDLRRRNKFNRKTTMEE